jgi:hypothetical protein
MVAPAGATFTVQLALELMLKLSLKSTVAGATMGAQNDNAAMADAATAKGFDL